MTNGFDLVQGLAWPFVVLFLAVAYKTELLSFLPKIISLLPRTSEIEGWGLKWKGIAIEQQKAVDRTADNQEASKIDLKDIPGLTRTEAIAQAERDIHARLKDITVGSDPVDVLVRNLAQARIEALFGVIYAAVFGSQIAGLKELQARRRVHTAEAYKFYQHYAQRSPETYADYGFAGWVGFVKNHGLLDRDGEDLVMTPLGDDFLTWLEARQLPEGKPF